LSLWLLAAGGILYSTGVIFHVWKNLRFQNAIWHGFVLVAACCHYSAVLACVVFARGLSRDVLLSQIIPASKKID
jgi:hemolysin III